MGASLHCLASAVAWGWHLLRASLTPLSCKGPARMAVWGPEEGEGPGAWLCTPTCGILGGVELERGLKQGRRSWGCNTGR